MEEIRSFVFYRSFYESAKYLSENERLKVYDALMEYSLNGIELELDGAAKALFLAFKPQIEANNKRRENGKKGAEFGSLGGRPSNENPNETPKEPQNNPEETPNLNINVNLNNNDNIPPCSPPAGETGNDNPDTPNKSKKETAEQLKQELKQIFTSKTSNFSVEFINKVKEWLEYKKTEKRFSYKPIGLKNLLNEICEKEKEYGESAVIKAISHSIASGWDGIVWEKLEKSTGGNQNGSTGNIFGSAAGVSGGSVKKNYGVQL